MTSRFRYADEFKTIKNGEYSSGHRLGGLDASI